MHKHSHILINPPETVSGSHDLYKIVIFKNIEQSTVGRSVK